MQWTFGGSVKVDNEAQKRANFDFDDLADEEKPPFVETLEEKVKRKMQERGVKVPAALMSATSGEDDE